MKTQTVPAPAARTRTRTADCGCGCGGGCGEAISRCCGVECLVRPNFYCGQILTDADLSVMVQWSRDRFALSRYRDGWGVVCGLEVTCSAPDGGGNCGCSTPGDAKIWIGAGYAVDCCGNDLVVCEPIPVDLSNACRPEGDPCIDPCAPVVKRDEQKPDAPADDVIQLEGLEIPRRDLIVVDLALRYGERPTSGQKPMFRGRCVDLDACEPSRIRECPVPQLTVRELSSLNEYSQRDDYERLLKRQVQEVTSRIMALLSEADPEKLIRRLSNWRMYGTCFLVDWVRAQDVVSYEVRRKIGQWLLLDWIGHIGTCDCRTCRTDEGVPLARLVLWRKDGRTDCCRPLWVMPNAPWRRELSRDCRPTAHGKLDLVQWLGASKATAEAALRKEGIEVRDDRMQLKTIDETREYVFSVARDDMLHLQTVVDWVGHERVIGFGQG